MLTVPFGWRAWYRIARHQRRVRPAAARLAQFGAIQLGWWLDALPGRRWRDVELATPIFILGHQRSGTTFLHRILADQPGAVGSTLAHMALPALTWWQLLRVVQRLDARAGGRLANWLAQRQSDRLEPLDPIHRIRLDLVEEDEFYFWSLCASAMAISGDAGLLTDSRLQTLCGWRVDPAHADIERHRWAWYRECLQKRCADRAAVAMAPRWIVAKNPAFSRQIPALLETFPEARVIVLHREPTAAIASRLALIEAIWQLRSAEAVLPPVAVDAIVQQSIETYRWLQRDAQLLRERLPAHHVLHVPSSALRAQPGQVLQRLADQFGMPPIHLPAASPAPATAQEPASLARWQVPASRVSSALSSLYGERPWEAAIGSNPMPQAPTLECQNNDDEFGAKPAAKPQAP